MHYWALSWVLWGNKLGNYISIKMKHIKFEFAEPIVGIQRVRNEVFLGDDGKLWVLSASVKQQIQYLLWVYGVKVIKLRARKDDSVYNKIRLQSGYYFAPSNDGEEILVMQGEDRIWVENELGEDITPASDLDVDEVIFAEYE